ncbi:SIR2 family protein [Mycolicibacterium sp. OfavD-34-C]|uniref:SIR2 family protein n=1 Tax=Mycolicibacterium sp. OfavD-34-C TaxID=2917746 RepID=UPI001EF60510|nr:SIR2 family protein [Mycolicibacterium sp. OfavD-34-C]MCG7583942.1 SIR2 family protein [Mycolicibacterium sp. OfavD-34-C]
MGGSADFAASEVSVAQVLTLIDERFGGLIEAVARGLYVPWIGSGISRNRVAGLDKLVARILEYLQSRIDPAVYDCPYRRAFEAVIDLADLSDLEAVHTDFGRDVREWETHQTIVSRLCNKYSELLDIELPEHPRDFLLWEVVDPRAEYGDGLVDPDAEHYCLAVLVLEGAVQALVSANWDGLIEKAIKELSGPDSAVIDVCVTSEDFRSSTARARILKFHGCAVMAGVDEDAYRSYLVGRRSQITDWPNDQSHYVMRTEMTLLAARRHTLMVGLSAQDENIQALFSASKAMLAWQWPVAPPTLVFAEDSIGNHQRNILRVVYGDSYEGNEADIASSALLRAYGKPLLFALMLGVASHKIELLAKHAWGSDEDGTAHPSIESGLGVVLSRTSAAIRDPSDSEVRRAISHVSRSLSLLREGRVPAAGLQYMPISTSPAHDMIEDPNIVSGGLPQAALALAILGTEFEQGTWELSTKTPASSDNWAPVTVTAGESASKLFFAANSSVAVQLELNGYADQNDGEVVVIHSAQRPTPLQRSPSSAPGRTGEAAARHVDMVSILTGSPSYIDLRRQFREELTL